MKRKFRIGQVVTTSKCSFLENRLSDSLTIMGHLPESAEGVFYWTQRNSDVPELIMTEGELSPSRAWELS
jgi:hypothetical protein